MPSFIYDGLYNDSNSTINVRGACSGLTAVWIASSQRKGRAIGPEDFDSRFDAAAYTESRYFREGVIEGTSGREVASLGQLASIYRAIMFGRLNIVPSASHYGTFAYNVT